MEIGPCPAKILGEFFNFKNQTLILKLNSLFNRKESKEIPNNLLVTKNSDSKDFVEFQVKEERAKIQFF